MFLLSDLLVDASGVLEFPLPRRTGQRVALALRARHVQLDTSLLFGAVLAGRHELLDCHDVEHLDELAFVQVRLQAIRHTSLRNVAPHGTVFSRPSPGSPLAFEFSAESVAVMPELVIRGRRGGFVHDRLNDDALTFSVCNCHRIGLANEFRRLRSGREHMHFDAERVLSESSLPTQELKGHLLAGALDGGLE